MRLGFGWTERWSGGRMRRLPSVGLYAGHGWEFDGFEVTVVAGPRLNAAPGEVAFKWRWSLHGPGQPLLDQHPLTWWLPLRPIIQRFRLVGYSHGYGRRCFGRFFPGHRP